MPACKEDSGSSGGTRRQIEVSHGSASTKASIYESIEETPCCSCWIEFFLVLFILLLATFFVVIWFDFLPVVSPYLLKHPYIKKIVLTSSASLCGLLFLISCIRLICKIRRNGCCQSTGPVLYFPHGRTDSATSLIKDDSPVCENYRTFSFYQASSRSHKINELSEDDLHDIRRVLTCFNNYHDEDDWCARGSPNPGPTSIGQAQNPILTAPKAVLAVKVVLVGNPNVGKTSIFHRVLYDRFSDYYNATLGADLGHTTLHIFPTEANNHLLINIQLWDIAGSERFSDLAHIVYKDAVAYIVISDITSADCEGVLAPWVSDITSLTYDPYIALFMNKVDLGPRTKTSNARSSMIGLQERDVFYVSARTGFGLMPNLVNVVTKAVLHQIENLL